MRMAPFWRNLGCPDMRHAIGYTRCITRAGASCGGAAGFRQLSRSISKHRTRTRFPALRLARLAMTRGGIQGASV